MKTPTYINWATLNYNNETITLPFIHNNTDLEYVTGDLIEYTQNNLDQLTQITTSKLTPISYQINQDHKCATHIITFRISNSESPLTKYDQDAITTELTYAFWDDDSYLGHPTITFGENLITVLINGYL